MSVRHYLSRTEYGPGDPDNYAAPCGYESGDKKEFTSDVLKVTCEACRVGRSWRNIDW